MTKETFEDGDTVTYKYDNNGVLAKVTDSATGITTTYYYDSTDRLMKYVESGTDYAHSVGYQYDSINNLTKLVETINGVEHTTSYTYDDDNRVESVTNGAASEHYSYDGFGRVNQQTTKHNGNTVLTQSATFRTPASGKTSAQVATYTVDANGYDITYTYTYDNNGNILSISDGTNTTSYVYDSANQLVRENNQAGNYTHTWTYDNAGNILSRTEYAYTTGSLEGVTPTDTITYTYGDEDWGDLLTGYDGQTITSDAIGNMLSDGTWAYTWEHGRELASMSNGTDTWTYTYNADGLRAKKTNGTDTYTYVYNGSQLVQMTKGADALYFSYDANGAPMAVTYNSTTYYYVTNIQGDIVAILDTTGSAVVTYAYDAWGNVLSVTGSMADTLGATNPLRYRGYVYDTETGLYYVSSRYYDPEVGRWINADGFVSTGQDITGYNMFAYCGNNPVNRKDPTGQFWITALIVTAVVAVCTVGLSGCSSNTPASAPEPYSNQANCYAYAMKLENDPRTGKPFQRKPQPGEFSGNGLTARDLRGDSETVKSNINKKVLADAEVLNLNYTEVSSADHIAKSGNWVVALVYATDGTDYHWYRRNDDGTWSHKPGPTPIISWDASGHIITDPATCNRGIYDGFLGYYEVGPN